MSPAKQLLIQQVDFVNSRHFFQHRSRAKHWFKNLKILNYSSSLRPHAFKVSCFISWNLGDLLFRVIAQILVLIVIGCQTSAHANWSLAHLSFFSVVLSYCRTNKRQKLYSLQVSSFKISHFFLFYILLSSFWRWIARKTELLCRKKIVELNKLHKSLPGF